MQNLDFEILTTGKPVMDTRSVIRGCVEKNIKCQKLLYEKYYRYAFKIAFRYIYRYDCVADVVNDGFVKVFKNIGSFLCTNERDEERRLLGWIKRIIVNTAIDELRRTRQVTKSSQDENIFWEEPRSSNSADALILYKELICHVKKLPASYRIVFNMFVIDGFSHQEIATHLGISIGASKSNLSRARAILKGILTEERVAQTTSHSWKYIAN